MRGTHLMVTHDNIDNVKVSLHLFICLFFHDKLAGVIDTFCF
ncbi:hypothetical protein [Moraxella lacunata]